MYGKVTTQQIADTLSKAAEHEIDKRSIKIEDISALGTYKATIRLSTEVQAQFNVEVVQQASQATGN